MMTEDKEIYELYDRFRREVKEGIRDMYYDEDELALIFDLATDERDTYTQLEVLMLGRQLFPDSDQLAVRQGFMIDCHDRKSLIDFLDSHPGAKGVLWDILRIKSRVFGGKEAVVEVQQLIDNSTFSDDEEIIQFVDLVEYFNLTDWFVDHYENFIDNCAYRDTALSECAHLFESDYPDLAIILLEELSRIDPFGADTWLKLSNLYLDKGNIEDAAMSIDYAKAIRPDDMETIMTEASIRMERDITDPKASELLQQVVKERPDWYLPRQNLARCYRAQGKEDLAELVLDEDREPDELLDSDENISADSEDMLFETSLMERYLAQDRPLALNLLRRFDRLHGLSKKAYLYVHLLYEAGELEEITEFMERERPEGSRELILDPISLAMYAAALLRTGRTREAADVAKEYLVKTSQAATTVESKLTIAGVKIALSYILASAEQGRWSPDEDPLALSMS